MPIPLAAYMTDKESLWRSIIAKYGLHHVPYEQIASWKFGDFILNSKFDNVSSTIKARRAGFPDCIDTEDMFRSFFDSLRAMKIIPEPQKN